MSWNACDKGQNLRVAEATKRKRTYPLEAKRKQSGAAKSLQIQLSLKALNSLIHLTENYKENRGGVAKSTPLNLKLLLRLSLLLLSRSRPRAWFIFNCPLHWCVKPERRRRCETLFSSHITSVRTFVGEAWPPQDVRRSDDESPSFRAFQRKPKRYGERRSVRYSPTDFNISASITKFHAYVHKYNLS